MDFYCFVKGNEIFLIFRSVNSNLVTRMSPKVRNEPGFPKLIFVGVVKLILFHRLLFFYGGCDIILYTKNIGSRLSHIRSGVRRFAGSVDVWGKLTVRICWN